MSETAVKRPHPSQLERALSIAAAAHMGQRDKAGSPYVLHPLRVMLTVWEEELSAGRCAGLQADGSCGSPADEYSVLAAAVLHDVVEDTDVTPVGLVAAGIAPRAVGLVCRLTKARGEKREDYLARIKEDPDAVRIKLADLQDNLDRRRIPDATDKDKERWRVYEEEVEELEAAREQEPGRRRKGRAN